MAVYISIICFLIYLGVLFVLQKKGKSFNVRVVAGLFGGIIFGAILKTVADDEAVSESLRWISLVGTAYTKLLKMMVIPLIFVSIVCAIINQKSGKNLGKITALVLAILLSTAAVAAVVGGVTATAFGVSAEGLEIGEAESKKTSQLEEKAQEGISFEDTIIDIIPSNPIYALTGQGNNATLSVVLFAAFLGIGVIGVRTYAPEQAEFAKYFGGGSGHDDYYADAVRHFLIDDQDHCRKRLYKYPATCNLCSRILHSHICHVHHPWTDTGRSGSKPPYLL